MVTLMAGYGPVYDVAAVLVAHTVDGLIQVDQLGGLFEHIDLLHTPDQATKLYTYQSDEHASCI